MNKAWEEARYVFGWYCKETKPDGTVVTAFGCLPKGDKRIISISLGGARTNTDPEVWNERMKNFEVDPQFRKELIFP